MCPRLVMSFVFCQFRCGSAPHSPFSFFDGKFLVFHHITKDFEKVIPRDTSFSPFKTHIDEASDEVYEMQWI